MPPVPVVLKALGMGVVTALGALAAWTLRGLTLGRTSLAYGAASRCCRIWAWILCRILRVRVVPEGPIPKGVFIAAANHTTYLDILVLASLYPTVFVAKHEIRSWPFLGLAVGSGGTLFVDRERARDVIRVGRDMETLLRKGVPLTLFPEGRASDGSSVLPFLPSLFEAAARTQAPCYAITLHYETPRSSKPPRDTVSWYSSTPFLPHLFRLMEVGGIEATVRIAPEPIRSSDRKTLSSRLHDEVVGRFTPVRSSPSLPLPDGRPSAQQESR